MAYDEVENEVINLKIYSFLKLCFVSGDVVCVSCPIHIKGVNRLLLCNLLFCTILNLLMLYAMSNLSLAAEVMYISVSSGFWMIYPMILEQGLQMTLTVAYIDSPAM